MLRTAPAIALLIRQFEDRYVNPALSVQDRRVAQDCACQPKHSHGSPTSRISTAVRITLPPLGAELVELRRRPAQSLATGKLFNCR